MLTSIFGFFASLTWSYFRLRQKKHIRCCWNRVDKCQEFFEGPGPRVMQRWKPLFYSTVYFYFFSHCENRVKVKIFSPVMIQNLFVISLLCWFEKKEKRVADQNGKVLNKIQLYCVGFSAKFKIHCIDDAQKLLIKQLFLLVQNQKERKKSWFWLTRSKVYMNKFLLHCAIL